MSMKQLEAVQRSLLSRAALLAAVIALLPCPAAAQDCLEWGDHTAPPGRRNGHAMAYDSGRGVTVLFGGRTPSVGDTGDTWEWDGAAWTLRSTTGPSPRINQAMAYDSGRGATVLFGGFDNESPRGDTWEFPNCDVACPPYDGDCDEDRDLADFADFQGCFGPGNPPTEECAPFDLIGDEGVDLADLASLANQLTGPVPPPLP